MLPLVSVSVSVQVRPDSCPRVCRCLRSDYGDSCAPWLYWLPDSYGSEGWEFESLRARKSQTSPDQHERSGLDHFPAPHVDLWPQSWPRTLLASVVMTTQPGALEPPPRRRLPSTRPRTTEKISDHAADLAEAEGFEPPDPRGSLAFKVNRIAAR